MAVTKISNSGIKTGVLKYDSMLAGNAAYDPAATWLIQRVNGTGSATSITFSNIPQTYQHLQIRALVKNTNTVGTGAYSTYLTANGTGGTSYTAHRLYGDGASVGASASTSAAYTDTYGGVASNNSGRTNMFGAIIIDIHDYTSTTKNKTFRIFTGYDYNGGGTIELTSGLFMSTSAVTSLTLQVSASNWTSTSTFALYGFIGA